MTSFKKIATLGITMGLLLAPMVASAGPIRSGLPYKPSPYNPSKPSKAASVQPNDEVAALRCAAASARNDMHLSLCLAGCARRESADASFYDESCEQRCLDRGERRAERLSCDVDTFPAPEPSEALPSDTLARAQGLPTKLTYKDRQECYWSCRHGKGAMSMTFCRHSCF